MLKNQNARNVQKTARKLYMALKMLQGHGDERIKRIPMGGLAHMVQLHPFKVGIKKYAIGYHKDDYVQTFLLFDCEKPEECIDNNPVVTRIDCGKITGRSLQQAFLSQYSTQTIAALNSDNESEVNSLGRAISIVYGEFYKIKKHFNDPFVETVPLEDCMKYTPFLKESRVLAEETANSFY